MVLPTHLLHLAQRNRQLVFKHSVQSIIYSLACILSVGFLFLLGESGLSESPSINPPHHWEEFANDLSGEWERIYFIDRSTFVHSDNKTTLWMREEYLDPARPLNIAYQLKIDCTQQQYYILASQDLSGKNTPVEPWYETNAYNITDAQTGEMRAYHSICDAESSKQ